MVDPELHRAGGELFDALVDLPTAERAAALEEARRENPERAAYAERLLQADAGAKRISVGSALFNRSMAPAPCGAGSRQPITTRAICASRIASVQGPVRPW